MYERQINPSGSHCRVHGSPELGLIAGGPVKSGGPDDDDQTGGAVGIAPPGGALKKVAGGGGASQFASGTAPKLGPDSAGRASGGGSGTMSVADAGSAIDNNVATTAQRNAGALHA
jgi:hypothetical protein